MSWGESRTEWSVLCQIIIILEYSGIFTGSCFQPWANENNYISFFSFSITLNHWYSYGTLTCIKFCLFFCTHTDARARTHVNSALWFTLSCHSPHMRFTAARFSKIWQIFPRDSEKQPRFGFQRHFPDRSRHTGTMSFSGPREKERRLRGSGEPSRVWEWNRGRWRCGLLRAV